jgi:replicative DNA helicase
VTAAQDVGRQVSAEEILIGSLLHAGVGGLEQCQAVQESDFELTPLGALLTALRVAAAAGSPVDPFVARSEWERLGLRVPAERGNAATYLFDLYQAGVTAGSLGWYAGQVAAAGRLRRLGEVGRRIEQSAAQAGAFPDDLAIALSRAREDIDNIAPVRARDRLRIVGEHMAETIDLIGTVPEGFIRSPWPDLDHIITGFYPDRLYVFAGRPGGGKSIVGAQVAKHTADHRRGGEHLAAYVASLEMGQHDYNQRLLSMVGGINLSDLQIGREHVPDDTIPRAVEVHAAMLDLPLYVDCTEQQTVEDICANAREVAGRHPLGMVVVDYLQIIHNPDVPGRSRERARYEQVGANALRLKQLAKELHVPVVALAQVGRAADSRRPLLSDLRESGDIENHADVVVFLHDPKEETRAGEVDVIVEKNRHGPKHCTVTMAMYGHYSRLVCMSQPMPAAAKQFWNDIEREAS